jgi:NDP-sugar pyrophosphorylase family protein
MFEPDLFFDLAHFVHRGLFKKGKPVWSVLDELEPYLEGLVHQIEGSIPSHATCERMEKISIGKGVVIEPGVHIQGPCWIGPGAILRHGSYIRGGCIIGAHAVVGHVSEIKHSILLDASSAAHFCYVGDSIVGRGANLGAGVKCANLRLDKKEVKIEGALTGRKKLGAIVGDGVQVGCNAVLSPGTVMGKNSAAYPLALVRGTVPSGALFKDNRIEVV